jgi:hypothetical protein
LKYYLNEKTFHVHESKDNIVKIAIFPKLIFRFMVFPVKILALLINLLISFRDGGAGL